jgi:hypothetical protein
VPGIFCGGKGGLCLGLTILPLLYADFLKSGSLKLLQPSGLVTGLHRDSLTLLFDVIVRKGLWDPFKVIH